MYFASLITDFKARYDRCNDIAQCQGRHFLFFFLFKYVNLDGSDEMNCPDT